MTVYPGYAFLSVPNPSIPPVFPLSPFILTIPMRISAKLVSASPSAVVHLLISYSPVHDRSCFWINYCVGTRFGLKFTPERGFDSLIIHVDARNREKKQRFLSKIQKKEEIG